MSSNDTKTRIIFMGTPDFAVPGLKRLIAEPDFEIIAVYTQSDKPVGRKQELTMPPIKKLALENNITVFQPLKIKEEIENIKSLNPDLIVVIAYGKIIPQAILDIPKYGCINVHASLLPKYRGAACLNAPILNGDKESGVTIMKMEAGLDTGPIIKQEKIQLSDNITLPEIHDKLSLLGADILVKTLKSWITGELKEVKQDDSKASYISILKKEDGKINFNGSSKTIERMIRAYNPWPGTYCIYNNDNFKILEAIADQDNLPGQIGQVHMIGSDIKIKCNDGSLVLKKIQLPGKKAMDIKTFLNGNNKIAGTILS